MTLVQNYQKVRATNSTASSFAAKSPTTTEPSGDGVIALRGGSVLTLKPYGVGADNSAFNVRVITWRKIATQWVPTFLGQFAATLSGIVGNSGEAVVDTERFADTISSIIGIGVPRVDSADVVADSVPNEISFGLSGETYAEVLFDMDGATSGNCLYVEER